jgi:hypothetical protein
VTTPPASLPADAAISPGPAAARKTNIRRPGRRSKKGMRKGMKSDAGRDARHECLLSGGLRVINGAVAVQEGRGIVGRGAAARRCDGHEPARVNAADRSGPSSATRRRVVRRQAGKSSRAARRSALSGASTDAMRRPSGNVRPAENSQGKGGASYWEGRISSGSPPADDRFFSAAIVARCDGDCPCPSLRLEDEMACGISSRRRFCRPRRSLGWPQNHGTPRPCRTPPVPAARR